MFNGIKYVLEKWCLMSSYEANYSSCSSKIYLIKTIEKPKGIVEAFSDLNHYLGLDLLKYYWTRKYTSSTI
jgi:hypothetical protein